MKQSIQKSVFETYVNVISGLAVSLIIQILVYPMLGIPVSLNQNLQITIIFFIASFIRSYIIRRIFNNLK